MTAERPPAAICDPLTATPETGDDELYLALRAAGASPEEAESCLEAQQSGDVTWERPR